MLTTTHVLMGAAVFGKTEKPKRTIAGIAGGLLPDASIFFMFFWAVITGHSQQEIWSDVYFRPEWQEVKNGFNSLWIWGSVLALGLWLKRDWLWALGGSATIHCIIDMLTHHDDGHAHFWPFSNWKFESPVSYWDPNHHGNVFSVFEIGVTMALTLFIWFTIKNWWMRAILALAWLGGLGTYIFFKSGLGGAS